MGGRCSPKAQTAQGSTIFHCGLHCGRGGSFSRTLRGWRGRWNKAPQWRPQGSAQCSFVVPSWVSIAVQRGSKMEKQHVWMNAFLILTWVYTNVNPCISMHEAKRTEHSETECSVTEHRFFEQLLRRASLNASVAWVSTENALILAQGVHGALVQDPCRFSSAWLELSA